MATPGSQAPAPGGAVRRGEACLRACLNARLPEALAMRVIATTPRLTLLAQKGVRKRFFMPTGQGRSIRIEQQPSAACPGRHRIDSRRAIP